MNKNYFSKKTTEINELKHFPFSNFNEFKTAYNDNIIEVGIPSDTSRQWVTANGGVKSILISIPLILMFIVPFYPIIASIITGNYLYLLLTPVYLFLIITAANPMSGKAGGNFLILLFILILVIYSIITRTIAGPHLWLPILLTIFLVRKAYSLANSFVKLEITRNEPLVCLLWKKNQLSIRMKDGRELWQRWVSIGEQSDWYDDIEKEWNDSFDYQEEAKVAKE